ncbi:MAG: histidine kinase dimerization/phospho-acceptor domain-containing protein [Candidatus Binatia bacterium]
MPKRPVTPRRKPPAAVSPKPCNPFDEMAHQLAQPLSAIMGYARGSQLRIQTNQLAPKDLDRALEGIAREALRAGDLLRQLRETMKESRS